MRPQLRKQIVSWTIIKTRNDHLCWELAEIINFRNKNAPPPLIFIRDHIHTHERPANGLWQVWINPLSFGMVYLLYTQLYSHSAVPAATWPPHAIHPESAQLKMKMNTNGTVAIFSSADSFCFFVSLILFFGIILRIGYNLLPTLNLSACGNVL